MRRIAPAPKTPWAEGPCQDRSETLRHQVVCLRPSLSVWKSSAAESMDQVWAPEFPCHPTWAGLDLKAERQDRRAPPVQLRQAARARSPTARGCDHWRRQRRMQRPAPTSRDRSEPRKHEVAHGLPTRVVTLLGHERGSEARVVIEFGLPILLPASEIAGSGLLAPNPYS